MIPKGTLRVGMYLYTVRAWDGGETPTLTTVEVLSVARVFATLRSIEKYGKPERFSIYDCEKDYWPTREAAIRHFIDRAEKAIKMYERSIENTKIGKSKAEKMLADEIAPTFPRSVP